MLRKVMELSEDNNKMIKKMRRTMRFGFYFKLLYWILIIGAGIGAFYYSQPYIEKAGQAYSGLKENVDNAQNIYNSVKKVLPGN